MIPRRHLRAALALALLPSLANSQSAPPPTPATEPVVRLPDIDVIGATPLLGSGVAREKVPAATQVLTPADIDRTGIPSLTDALGANVPALNIVDTSGNPFQPSVLFRGFNASPIEGDTQGLAVYVNGSRFNEPFGQTVNWDLIPSNAIARVNIESANPVFGLNALGGAISVQLKDGFAYHGGEAIAYAGSYGRLGASVQYGHEADDTSVYVALSAMHEQGWRQTSNSDLRQFYGDLGWRSDRGEAHVNVTLADNDLNNPGASPVELLDYDRSAEFTAPNVVHNKYLRLGGSATYDISDKTALSTAFYYANLSQRLSNGVTVDSEACDDDPGLLCDESGALLTDRAGQPIPDYLNGGPYSGLSVQGTDTNAYGLSAQVSHYRDVFGRPNHLVVGASYDGGATMFDGSELLGGFTSSRFFTGPSVTIDQADLSIAPVRLRTLTNAGGLFFSDITDVTDRLALTLSGRLNVENVQLEDQIGTSLNGNHTFTRFNPGVGLTYRLRPGLTAFASYYEANRAPSPTELSCANIDQPCQLPNFFLGDPPLKQVVARGVEAGLRGDFAPFEGARVQWNLDVFRTDNSNDIIFVSSAVPGLDYFTNAGTTRRQGIDANVSFRERGLRVMLGYSLVDATFQSSLLLDSPLNPGADANGQEQVRPGSQLPGVPRHRFKAVAEYDVTDAWTVGAAAIVSSGQYLFGDEANVTRPTGAYAVVNFNTSYRITPHVQLFALVTNAFDAKYATYGTFAPTTAVPIVEVPGASNPRDLSPAAPVSGYGGVRVTF